LLRRARRRLPRGRRAPRGRVHRGGHRGRARAHPASGPRVRGRAARGAGGELMAAVRPLAGLRYDPARAGDVGQLLAPPYDVITAAEQAELYARSPYNVIRLILPREAERGAAAAQTLRDWIAAGILAPDPELGAPLVDVSGWHQLWRVTDAPAIARVEAALTDRTVIIADGHHRYETALAYRDEQRGNEAARYVLTYLANMEEEGVVILPTHRLVRGPLRLGAAALEARLGESFVLEALDPRRRRVAREIDCVLPARRLRLRAEPAARQHLRGLPPVLR